MVYLVLLIFKSLAENPEIMMIGENVESFDLVTLKNTRFCFFFYLQA